MIKNRIFSIGMAAVLTAGLLAGCGSSAAKTGAEASTQAGTEALQQGTTAAGEMKETSAAAAKDGKKLSIVCTSFPQYDWVRHLIAGAEDQFDVTYLLEKGVDLHSYQATAADIAKVGEADLFVYVGGESDAWAEDALANATNKEIRAVNMVSALGESIKEEEVVEGMQDEEHDHDHESEDPSHEGEDHEGEEPEYDEHVWLSLKNAKTLTEDIAGQLEEIAPEQAELIRTNCDAYTKELSALDQEYADAVAAAKLKTVLFGDRFPFRYLVDDYGLQYYAAFVGCSAETEASFETITFLAGKVNELKLPAILVIENSNQKIAETIRQNTETKDQKILVMDSLQSVSSEDIAAGRNYLEAMQKNLATLTEALSTEA